MAAPASMAIVRVLDAAGGVRFTSAGAPLVQNADQFTLRAGVEAENLQVHWSPGQTIEVTLRDGRGRSQRWTCTEPKFADDGSLTLDGKKVSA